MDDIESAPNLPEGALFTCWTTAPNEETARSIAKAFVDLRIAACAQIDGPLTSIYVWEGKRCESREYRLWLKIVDSRIDAARECIRELHPYDTPQWIENEATKVDEKYLKWAKDASNLRGFQKPEPI